MGLQSLPVAFGVDTAKWICVASIDITQVHRMAFAGVVWGSWSQAQDFRLCSSRRLRRNCCQPP
jgi:4-hydroxybenzoate polyprenyltransferase